MNTQTLYKYLHAFGHLHRNQGLSPHKPVLLLAVLDEIGKGRITDNQIVLTLELVAAFREYWQALPLPPGNWLERSYLPYRYLLQEGFWELVKEGHTLTGKEVGEPYSITDARARIQYARFAPDLWVLVQNDVAREALRAHLLRVCFGVSPEDVPLSLPADPLTAQVDKLIAEAQSQPRPKVTRVVRESDAEYLRSQLFPRVVSAVYHHACAVCDLGVRVGENQMVQAAHIRDFSVFGDNHPSNGLALCANHHWAFDRGGFSVSDRYTLLVSPELTGTAGFVPAGSSLHLPNSDKCYPDLTALAWHREHKFRV